MDNTFINTLEKSLLAGTLFKNYHSRQDNYLFNKKFKNKQTKHLQSSVAHNVWLSLEVVSPILDFNEIAYTHFRQFMLEDLKRFKQIVNKFVKSQGGNPSTVIKLMIELLRKTSKLDVVDGLLIISQIKKLKNFKNISMRDINKGSITKIEFETLVDSYS